LICSPQQPGSAFGGKANTTSPVITSTGPNGPPTSTTNVTASKALPAALI